MEIDKQLVKKERIKTKLIERSFEVFNIDGTKNREVTQFVLLEVKINRHKEQINAAVMNLNEMNMFLGYDWLIKHNLKVNWSTEIIQFTRCSRIYKTRHQDILFIPKYQRIQVKDE